MPYLLKGALVEYASEFLGPLPNVVLFQFNPDRLTRTLEIPPRPTGASSRETNQAGEIPLEKIGLTAVFSAADLIADPKNEIARSAGIGPQLAALEMMVRPSGTIVEAVGQIVDKVSQAISGGGDASVTLPIPREQYPRVLFFWGRTRILPVLIDSLSFTETKYDHLLNPLEAEAQLSLTVITPDLCAKDRVAEGALQYSRMAKEAMAAGNLASSATELMRISGGVIQDIGF